jgi:nucleoside-diphosphate-sugar epimerase
MKLMSNTNQRAYVTGASGLIGQHLVHLLVDQGFDVTCVTRDARHLQYAKDLPIHVVEADVRDRERIRHTIAGHSVVFHLAAWVQFGVNSRQQGAMREINVDGTRNVLEEAWRSGARRIVYCSTIGALGSSGPAGHLGNEEQMHNGRFQSFYVKTKHEAYLVAKELAGEGAPIVLVLPNATYGPGDNSVIAQQLLVCIQGRMSAIPGVSGTYCYTHVDDVARGLWLAAEKGRIGESYILSGPALELAEFYAKVAAHAGVAPPKRRIPTWLLRIMARVLDTIPGGKAISKGRPINREAVAMITEANWAFSAAKAQSELGWRARTLDDGLDETLEWVRQNQATLAALSAPEPGPTRSAAA